ncbi:MAG: hypothetical protein ACLQUS_12070 [Desulfobaccales bacterium]
MGPQFLPLGEHINLILQGSQSLIYLGKFFSDQIELYLTVLVGEEKALDFVQLQHPLDANQQQTSGKQQFHPERGVKTWAGQEIFSHK